MFVGENARRKIFYEEFHPWGTSAYRSGDSAYDVSPRRYRYTGKERDEATGLDYHGLRYRVPWLGRWSTADPLGLVDGPNLYAYARNNPIALSDPSGGEAVTDKYAERPSQGFSETFPPPATPAPPSTRAPQAAPETPAPKAPAVPETAQPAVPSEAIDPKTPIETTPEPADPRTEGQALNEGLAEGLTGFKSLGEAWDALSDPNTYQVPLGFGYPPADALRGIIALGEAAIGLGEDIGRLQDEGLTIEQRAEGGGRAVGRGVRLLAEVFGIAGAFGTPRLPSTPSTTPKFNLLDRSKLRERRGRQRFQDPDDALDQLNGVSREQDRFRQGLRERPIDSIDKSKQRLRDATRGLAARKSLEKLAEVFEDVRDYLLPRRQPKLEEHR